jgi:D-alanine--poly(phosphoribitol) ligase subunit 2
MSTDPRPEIMEIFRSQLGVEVEDPATDVIETGLLDLLALVTLLVAMEERFGVQLPFDELTLDDFRSVDALGRLVVDGRS